MQRFYLISAVMMTLAACELPKDEPETPTGAEDFAAFCSACHGSGGTGDGDAATGLPRRPADLTRLSARNDGVYPMGRVMEKIWGYTAGMGGGAIMPNFGPLLESETVLFDSGDGIATPTPLRLVQLAEYVKSLQE